MYKVSQILRTTLLLAIFGQVVQGQATKFNAPIVSEELVFEEKEGLLAVEAEHFYAQSKSEIRSWFRTSKDEVPRVGRDEDEQHCFGASNNAYIEILPDERVTHADKISQGENFTNEPGLMAVVHYKVKINTPGRYYVWVRAFSTGSEDNGLHVGFNGTWPESGQRMQWCDGKMRWTWTSKQRTKEFHCGVPHQIYLDIEKPGIHDIQFSMREDGFEFDKFILTTNKNYFPKQEGPDLLISEGVLPAPFSKVASPTTNETYFKNVATFTSQNRVIPAQDFPVSNTKFYKEGKNWLAINPKVSEEASTSTTFKFESGRYDIIFVGVGENDGSSAYTLIINNKEIGSYQPPLSVHLFEEGYNFNALWENIDIKKGDTITVTAKIGSADGKEHTRGRWAGVIFAPAGKGKEVQDAPSSFSAK
ncbi:hypothetical protein [Siansivirga zeaxanthinifaciens]|nr:hypothetical protein [Siansivirga zeaxanthinifaciens]